MCQENYNTKNRKFKSLQEFEHGIIQNCLDNNEKTGQIAKKIGKDSSTIKKAITRYRTKICANPKCSHCLNYKTCHKEEVCEIGKKDKTCGHCKGCNIATENCPDYDPVIECKYLKGHRKVCNGCHSFKQCRKPKIVYKAEKAIKIQNTNKQKSLKVAKIDKIDEDNKKIYDEYVSSKIEKNISVGVTLATMSEEIKLILDISIPTLYSYIDKAKLKCRNINLLNKLKRKEKHNIKRENKRNKHRENGRSIHDLTEKQLSGDDVFEMDTVEGLKGSDLLLTMITMKQHFMFGLPMKSKHQADVVNELDNLEKVIGYERFSKIFRIGKTDNGCEFLDYVGLENSIEKGKKRLKIFYADAYASYQKALVENNHRIIRYMLEKGYDMAKLSKGDILNIMNRVNNYPRKCLNYSTPYLEMLKIIDEETLNKLGFYYISIGYLDMKSKKVA